MVSRSLSSSFSLQDASSGFSNSSSGSGKCCVCGLPLGGKGTASSELSLLVSLRTGKREGGLQFLHSACEDQLEEKFQACHAMSLPEATSDVKSFFSALDMDGNGVLSKEEVRFAVAALWVGDTRTMEREFEEKWKVWDTNGDGILCFDEVGGTNLPATFLRWVRDAAERRASTQRA